MLIACDVDLVVVDTLSPWMREFKSKTGRDVINADGNYELEHEMKIIMNEVGVTGYNPMSYWEKTDLYDDLAPSRESRKALKALHDEGHQILFVSSCVPAHIHSKRAMLNFNFPYHCGFIDTSDKHWVGYDVLIDDRIKHIELGHKHRSQAKHIMFTGIRRDGLPEHSENYLKIDNWNDVYENIVGE